MIKIISLLLSSTLLLGCFHKEDSPEKVESSSSVSITTTTSSSEYPECEIEYVAYNPIPRVVSVGNSLEVELIGYADAILCDNGVCEVSTELKRCRVDDNSDFSVINSSKSIIDINVNGDRLTILGKLPGYGVLEVRTDESSSVVIMRVIESESGEEI